MAFLSRFLCKLRFQNLLGILKQKKEQKEKRKEKRKRKRKKEKRRIKRSQGARD